MSPKTTFRRLTTAALLVPLLTAMPASGQTILQDRKLNAFDAAQYDWFGYSVAVSDTTVIVGAYGDDDAGSSSGSAYLFDTATGQLRFKLTASDAQLGDEFGRSVAISGTTAIVGAWRDYSSGSAYLFDTTTGQELFKLNASDAQSDDGFGRSVAISGTIAIVGASGDDDAGSSSGSAYLFDTITGQELFKLTASDAAADDEFGFAVAISGNTAIVGAYGDDDAGSSSGSAYLFDTTTGQQLMKLTASDAATDDEFGFAVAISGTTAIVGAFGDDDAGSSSGSAYLFDTTTGQQLFKLTASDAGLGDAFGRSVAISGTTVVVGAPWEDNTSRGSAYLFDINTGQQLFKFRASDAEPIDWFGHSVAISDTTVIAGSHYDDDGISDSGSVYQFFNLPNEIIQQPQGLIVSPGETATIQLLVANPGATRYAWRRNGVELVNGGNISGATTASLHIVAEPSDIAFYDCMVTYGWRPAFVSRSAALVVLPDSNACVADLNGDGVLNFFDVSVFLTAYGAGCP